MPDGKPAGVKCIHLADDYKCKIFGQPERPKVCIEFEAEELICGIDREEAMKIISDLENL